MDSLRVSKPSPGNYPEYYQNYFQYLKEDLPILENCYNVLQDSLAFWNSISEEHSLHRYEAGKWSIREMLLHITDTERIFSYRALCLARGEQKNLAGFDHNEYVRFSEADRRSWASLLQEYQSVKQASLDFFASLSEKQWRAKGSTDAGPINMAAMVYVIPGHDLHHQRIVKERYLPNLSNG